MIKPISGQTKLLAILGWPLTYTLSPRFQNAAIQAAGLDARYFALPCPSPLAFRKMLQGLSQSPHFIGANVTNPFKLEAARWARRLTPAAKATGAANTLFRHRGIWWGDNTDPYGFHMACRRLLGSKRPQTALVLGAGGAARAAIWALAQFPALGVTIACRRPGQGRALLSDLKLKQAAVVNLAPTTLQAEFTRVDLLVNTVSDEGFAKRVSRLMPRRNAAWAMDLRYAKAADSWVRGAKAKGWQAQDGLAMLLAQGAQSFERWFGRKAPLKAMRASLGGID